jgi:phytoene dehydrogenase-like protein
MDYEVIVIGGGIGGLTTAALLAARGVNVCLFERQSRVGGCVANFEHQGYTFEPTAGLYSGWEPEGIFHQIFSQLPVSPPEVRRLSQPYVVRLQDQTDVSTADDFDRFEANIAAAFPECGQAAINFYRKLWRLVELSDRDAQKPAGEAAARSLIDTSERFQNFIDGQLDFFNQCESEQCDLIQAARTLTAPLKGMCAIRGGGQALADILGESLKLSGGSLRLDAPVLRLAFDQNELPIGVDLLSGARIRATRAIVSNLTVWDTYGKLVGLSRTPKQISAALKQLHGRGAYLIFLAMDDVDGSPLRADHILALPNKSGDDANRPFMFAAAPSWDRRSPAGKKSVTVSTATDVESWFVFHEDATEHEARDQDALEKFWAQLHSSMPELGDSVEVIETATPQTFYEQTRRKFGMTGTPSANLAATPATSVSTHYPNLFLVGDTVSSGPGVDAICRSAASLANAIVSR